MNPVFAATPRIMGILNINDDSFSGDGSLDLSVLLPRAREMISQGADIIDIGAESARTNREVIPVDEEIRRLLAFIDRWEEPIGDAVPACEDQIFPPLLSVNSWRPRVIEAVLETGRVDLINDISGLPDPENARLCARFGATLLIMHTVGEPKVAHLGQQYRDILQELDTFFEARIAMARDAGLSEDQIILDPGIDFAKQKEDNLRIFRSLERLHRFGMPILLPISRKTVIGEVLSRETPVDRDAGTIACLARGIRAGCHLFRVHHVEAAATSVRLLVAIGKGEK